MWMGEEWREQGGTCWVGGGGENVTPGHTYAQTHTSTRSDIYITLGPSSSDAGTRSLPSMSLPLSFPSFFQVIPLVTSVLLISPYFSSPHSSLGLTATHVPSQSPSLKAHIALIKKKKGERDEEGKK